MSERIRRALLTELADAEAVLPVDPKWDAATELRTNIYLAYRGGGKSGSRTIGEANGCHALYFRLNVRLWATAVRMRFTTQAGLRVFTMLAATSRIATYRSRQPIGKRRASFNSLTSQSMHAVMIATRC